MVILSIMIRKTNMDNSLVWVDQETLDIASIFASKGILDRAFAEVGLCIIGEYLFSRKIK